MSDSAQTSQGGAKGIPTWATVLIALAVGLIAAGAVFVMMRSKAGAADTRIALLAQENTDLQSRVDSLTVEVEALAAAAKAGATAGASGAQSAGSSAGGSQDGKGTVTPTQTSVTQFTLIKKVTGSASSGYEMVADYAQYLTGAAAAAAATAHHSESPPPNDYYIVNDNPKLRTLPLAASADVVVLGWGGGDATAPSNISVAQFKGVVGPGSSDPRYPGASYWITIKGGTVVKIKQQYQP
jgi:hypothetical protein